MNNTEKLLRAFIEASGYEVEEVKGRGGVIGINKDRTPAYGTITVDYKVTKKARSYIKCNKCGTHLAYESPLNACLCGNSNNLERIG